MKLNLGCGNDILNPDEWINIDFFSDDERVYKVDLNKLPKLYDRKSLKYFSLMKKLKNIEYVKAHHILEHLNNLDSIMKFIHKVCIDGATIDIVVPLANTVWDVANPNHVRRFNNITFMYYTKEFQTSDVGLFRGYRLIKQVLEKEPPVILTGIEWVVANLHVYLEVKKTIGDKI